jgi:PEP-CTERM motif
MTKPSTAKYLSIAALAAAGAFASAAAVQPAHATIVATIVGAYDKDLYDTPELDLTNSSGGQLIDAQMVLRGYQPGTNNFGIVQTVPLSYSFLNGSTTDIIWGQIPGFANYPTSGPGGNLTSYDYDDEWGNTPAGYTNPACVVGAALCSPVGNFSVTFTATISGGTFNGDPVFAVFSPTTNFTGGFVGWEGLDQNGVSESVFDEHSGTFSGTMAIVQIGTPPPVPEPSTWVMMLVGFGGLGFAAYRARKGAKGPVPA